MSRHWKANKELTALIVKVIADRDKVFKEAKEYAISIGAHPVKLYYYDNTYGTQISGFVFTGEKPPADQEKFWVRIKGTDDGWRPRARTEQAKVFEKLKCAVFGPVMQKIGMQAMGAGSDGIALRRPGLVVVKGVGYITTPDDVTAKCCTRISDLTYEKLTGGNKKNKDTGKSPAAKQAKGRVGRKAPAKAVVRSGRSA